MRKHLIFVTILSVVFSPLKSQGEIDDQKRVMYRDESTLGVFLHSNGYGVKYRYGFWRNARNQFLLDASLDYVKHKQEVKRLPSYIYTTNVKKYAYGKENLFWEFKGLAGWQKELYRKIDRNGVSLRLYYSGGFSVGFIKPIYYRVFYNIVAIPGYQTVWDVDYMKFDPGIHQQEIGGTGPFAMGLKEIKVVPGLTGKTGLSFEYSQKDAIVHALEAGISLTAYPYEIPIMAGIKNNFLFFNLSVGYRFGKIIDISEAARAKSRKERREEKKAQRTALPYPLLY